MRAREPVILRYSEGSLASKAGGPSEYLRMTERADSAVRGAGTRVVSTRDNACCGDFWRVWGRSKI
jgi:hypothetical protein